MFSSPGQARWAVLTAQENAKTFPPAVYGHSTVCIKESAWGGPLVVTFGGTTGEGANSQVDNLWIWHESTGWKAVEPEGPRPPARGFHAAAVCGSLMYIFGGNRWETRTPPPAASSPSSPPPRPVSVRVVYDDFWVLDTVGMRWRQIAPALPSSATPSARSAAGLACLPSGDVMLFGGKSGAPAPSAAAAYSADVWCFHSSTCTWECLKFQGPAPRARALPTFLAADRGVYLYGGMDERSAPLGDLWLLSTAGSAFEWVDCKRPCPSGGHSGHCAALVEGCYYVVWGGKVPDPRITLFEKFEPVMSNAVYVLNVSDPKGRWAALPAKDIDGPQQPQPRVWAAMCELQPGELLIHGGMNGRDIFASCHLLKLPTDTAARSLAAPAGGDAAPEAPPSRAAGKPTAVADLIDMSAPDEGATASGTPPSPAASPAKPAPPAAAAPRPAGASLFSSITDALKSTVTSIGTVGTETASALTSFRSTAFSGRGGVEASPLPPPPSAAAAEPLQLSYPPRTAPGATPGPPPGSQLPPPPQNVISWLASHASPPPSKSRACVLVPLSDPFAPPRPPPSPAPPQRPPPLAPVTPPHPLSSDAAAAPAAPPSDDLESGPSSPVSEWVSPPPGSVSTSQNLSSTPSQSRHQEGSSDRASAPSRVDDGDEAADIDALVDELVAEVEAADAADAGGATPPRALEIGGEPLAGFDFGTDASEARGLETTWPPRTSAGSVHGRFREVGGAEAIAQGLFESPPPPPDMRAAADDSFESAEVSGILEANPLHALGLRLLSRRTSRLEFVSVDEARESTGAAAVHWLLSAPSIGALRLKDVDALLQEYRRLAPLGALTALARGPAAVAGCPGRLAHVGAQELRLRDVGTMLQEYHTLQRLAQTGVMQPKAWS